jgi:hypothetical protein
MRTEFRTLCAMLSLVFWMGTASAVAPTGTVVAVSGSCSAHGRTLKSGDAVQVSDMVDVPANGHLKLLMADGSVISVGPDSNMTVISYSIGGAGRQAKLSLAQGVLRAVVAPVGGPSTFEVSTAVGTASVHSGSADWFVVAEAGSAQVGVLAGTVDLTSAATRGSVSIPAHWGTRLESGLAPTMPRIWAQMEFNAVIRLTECCPPAQPKLETPPAR